MLYSALIRRRRYVGVVVVFVIVTLLLFHSTTIGRRNASHDITWKQDHFPLAWKHIHMSHGHGGAWYIPPSWQSSEAVKPRNITEAAFFASRITNKYPPKHLDLSTIPRIVHQTWKSADLESLPENDISLIETWLLSATEVDSEMAYLMWDDAGAAELMSIAYPEILPYYELLPKPVTKSDVFRVAVCNSIGGVYADIDTKLLRSPISWVADRDVSPWTDTETSTKYNDEKPQSVKLILGIEADTEENSDDYWRMGYTYPVQLTQWALAGTANHPVLTQFLQYFKATVKKAIKEANTSLEDVENDSLIKLQVQKILQFSDPLELTGPVAVTRATKDYLEEHAGLRWQALSGLHAESRSKQIEDVLILPITGFSPGRGKYGNMGSQPLNHPDARLQHLAQGSWRKVDFMVEIGKLCRSVLGQCRDWSKVPSN